MSVVKNIKKYTNDNIIDALSFVPQFKIKTNYSPYKFSNNNSLRNTLEKLNCKNKKNTSIKKSKNKSKDSEILINNYLSQRPRVNTEGNDINSTKMKFSRDFFKNRIDQIFKINNNKSNSNKRISNNKNTDNNFRAAKKNNIEVINQFKNPDNSNFNRKNNINFQFTRLAGNNANSYNKKIIEKSSNNEYNNNTNTHNFSQTQSYFNQNNKKSISNNNNQLYLGNSQNIKHKNNNKSEDIKKRNCPNNKIVKESKMKNFSGLLQQISPQYMGNNKLSHIQNYFKNIHKNKKIINNQKTQHNKEKKVLTTEPTELNNTNKLGTEEFILKDNSNYLVVTKNPTQITNIIEKKENNKYINNYFNICDSTNITNKNNNLNKNDDKSESDDNEYDTYEEIHYFFVNKIQKGKKLDLNMNNKKS
jgi:hypothetical protein